MCRTIHLGEEWMNQGVKPKETGLSDSGCCSDLISEPVIPFKGMSIMEGNIQNINELHAHDPF